MEAYKEVRDTVLFQAFRSEGNPTNYGENHISAETDVFIVSIITLFVGIGVAFLIILPGFRGKEQLYVLLRTAISLGIGLSILLCNFAQSWEKANVSVSVPYKAGSGARINAFIALHLGLRGFNVTLKDESNTRPVELQHELINYNEHFSWEWSQGRLGYGPQEVLSINDVTEINCISYIKAGRIQREYREAQSHGLPFPILWVTEYFTVDGEGIRFGRYYRLAGWYTHIVIWFAFALWLLTNILFQMVIQYGALLLVFTGKVIVFANILYCNIRNPIPLEIPFESVDGKTTVWLKPCFSWCYYLNLVNGIVCIILGVIAFYCDLRYTDETAEFFGIDVLQNYEDFIADVEEEKPEKECDKLAAMTRNVTYVGLRKRAPISSRLSRLQRSTVRGIPNPNAMLKPPKVDGVTMNNNHSQRDHKDDPEAGNIVHEYPSLRRKVRPEVPVYQNFIRESFAPVEEEVEKEMKEMKEITDL